MIRRNKARWSVGIVLGAAALVTPLVALSGPASATAGDTGGFFALSNSVNPTTDLITGSYSSSNMQVEVAVTPRDDAGLNSLLSALYTKGSPQYHKWLTEGVFDARYAPLPTTVKLVENYLASTGLKVESSDSPFLVRAVGTSSLVSNAFRTTLSTFKDTTGKTYFANSTPVYMPESLSGATLGVIGLTNTVRDATSAKPVVAHRVNSVKRAADAKTPKSSSCEEPYPTAAQQFAAVNDGTPIPFGYGGGPGCQGLTPSQTNSIYNAPNVGASGKGQGVTAGLFELSAYQASDIATWAHQFYGPSYTPPLTNVNVDGGPLAPVCPVGDTCPPSANGYAGDIEVDADIEADLSVAPDVSNLIVYNAPNDFTGQTELDEYTAIAKADKAAVVSSSWAVCENDATSAIVQAENVVFQQMASQGQSMFGAEGDTGAFSCIRSDGTTIVNVLDPPSQPWVTSVGGTSLESFNPGTNPHPQYPSGTETVWNVDNLCSNAAPAASNDNQGGFFWCAQTGAGGGGSSQWWGEPSYQHGPGIINPNTTYSTGPTGTTCSLAKAGTPCREDPDVSMNADEFTPYAEYCTGNANTPFSVCGTFSGNQNPPGWFGIGGTSLSSPLWSAIFADRDGYQGKRSGNANPLLYAAYDLIPSLYFHDITGAGQTTNNNGLFPTTPGYDLATGIGTPNMANIITSRGI
jgi:subtilase family serine protease